MLPKILHPTFDVTIPSIKKKTKVRPMLVKEEKILLMAKEGKSFAEILSGIKQVVNNCLVNAKVDNIDVNKLALFDLEYLFIKIRSVSVDSKAQVAFVDEEDSKTYEFDIDLEKIEVVFPEVKSVIQITKDLHLQMKYPESSIYDDEVFINAQTEEEVFECLVFSCLDTLHEKETVYKFKDMPVEEKKDFIDNLDLDTFGKIKEFLNNLPSLNYTIEYKNKNGNEKKVVLSSLNDFFTLG